MTATWDRDRLEATLRAKSAPDGECIIYHGAHNTRGYGMINHRPFNPVYAHRVSFWLHHGYLPPIVAHRCDTPDCVNIDHLFATTAAGNSADAKAKGRLATGARVCGGKLSPTDIAEILAIFPERPGRGRIKREVTYASVAADYGVHPESIGALVRRHR
jgi:hypothetical protein